VPLVEIAVALGQKAATTAIEPLIRDLLDVQDRQERELRAILERLDDLRTAPWRRARLLIGEASQARSAGDRRDRLEKAYDALLEAYSHFPEATRQRASAAIDLALVMGLLGDEDAARRWARIAFDDQVAAVASTVPQVREALNLPYIKAAQQGDFWDWVSGDLAEEERVIPPELRGGHSGDSWDAVRRDRERGEEPRTPAGRELSRLGDMVAEAAAKPAGGRPVGEGVAGVGRASSGRAPRRNAPAWSRFGGRARVGRSRRTSRSEPARSGGPAAGPTVWPRPCESGLGEISSLRRIAARTSLRRASVASGRLNGS
jgi:hypothetical protein